MVGNNDESQTGPQLGTRLPVNLEIPMLVFRERLEALRLRNGNDYAVRWRKPTHLLEQALLTFYYWSCCRNRESNCDSKTNNCRG